MVRMENCVKIEAGIAGHEDEGDKRLKHREAVVKDKVFQEAFWQGDNYCVQQLKQDPIEHLPASASLPFEENPEDFS